MNVSPAGCRSTDRRSSLTSTIDRGLSFLTSRQLPSGQFPIEGTHYADQRTEPDASIFATTHIVYSLGFVGGPSAARMIARALDYFLAEMRPNGLWRYWNKDAVWSGRRVDPFIPADLDDTASVSFLLRRHGVAFPDNATLCVLNRNQTGLFYTWLMMRPTATLNPRYWWTMVREVNVQRLALFWKMTEAGYRDIDGVVNANVLLYLGARPETAASIDWLKGIVRGNREADCDKWYRNAFSFWYALSRTYHAGVEAFGDVRAEVVAKVENASDPSGRIGEHALHTAAAMNTLLNFGGGDNPGVLDRAAAHLLATQADDGGWPSAPYYYGGPSLKAMSWGSRELTTGLCLEALARIAANGATGLPRE
jgi:hypothetical protein